MKLCVFHGNQRDLITCCNPKEMIAMGVFDNDFRFLSQDIYAALFREALASWDSIAEDNLFQKSKDSMPVVEEALLKEHRKTFFSWYIGFYYKKPGWEAAYRDMVAWHRATVWKMYNMLQEKNDKQYQDAIKQALLEIAWNWQQSPENLLPKS